MKIPASLACTGFKLPLMAPCLRFLPGPKLANRIFATDRFMALAINSVNNRPAAPTNMPAIMSAGFCSTKPSRPTASPVKALYTEITTGMSAPPIGKVIKMPYSKAMPKKISMRWGIVRTGAAPPTAANTIYAPTMRHASSTTPLNICNPGTCSGFLSRASSLAQAITEPDSEMDPINAPSRVTTKGPTPWV